MRLLRARITSTPFSDLVFDLAQSDGQPRSCSCIFGGPGTGKTTFAWVLAHTRPGHGVMLARPGTPAGATPPWALTEWSTGDDEPGRPHPLRVTTPGIVLENEDEQLTLLRRREQTVFDRKAVEGGFVFVAFAGSRWFGRSPLLLSAPDRLVGRYDVRATAAFDDATRGDLSRETKQTLAYAAIGDALSPRVGPRARPAALLESLRDALAELTPLTRCRFAGCDPSTLEPMFESVEGVRAPFDELPTGIRHVVSFVALTLRSTFAAYPDRQPRDAEVVAVIDDAELHLPPAVQQALPAALRRALPRAQWILTTSSPHLAAGLEADELCTLRRLEVSGRIELFTGPLAVVH